MSCETEEFLTDELITLLERTSDLILRGGIARPPEKAAIIADAYERVRSTLETRQSDPQHRRQWGPT